jgi:transmembrane sensor
VDDKDWQRLARYYAGETSPGESAEIEGWLAADAARMRSAESMREAWDLSSALRPAHGGDAQRAWRRVAAGMHAGTAPATPAIGSPSAPRTPRRLAWYAGIAAALLLALLPVSRLLTSGAERPVSAAREVREYATTGGEKLRLLLPDGSTIELGVGSRVRVPTPFSGQAREVEIEGMALFKVSPDPERPFLVHARDAVTRVIGTEFVVRAYAGDEAVRVAVVEGKVALRSSSAREDAGTVLTRGQVGRLASDGTARIVESGKEFSQLVSWTGSRLEFVDRPLAEVLSELELWYGVEIELEDRELAARPVSTVVEGDRLQRVLDMIALVVDARYEQSGDTITFSPQ